MVKKVVYQGVKYKGKDIGTATIFQGDLRISTNVISNDGNRAIGTRVSEEVYEQVLKKGLPWIARAFVVNNWYIAAYEPIKNIEGKIIGVLYVGILEEKFTDMRNRAIAMFSGITLTGMIMALVEYDWPGNVRELENAIERAVVLTEDDMVKPSDLLYYGLTVQTPSKSDTGQVQRLIDVEKEHIAKTLKKFNRHRGKAAKSLGIDRKTLRLKLKKYGIE